ncbi:MAG: hypothetical protein Q9173_002148 [Seirophora scorigena]
MRMSRELRFQASEAGLGKRGADNFLPGAFYQHPTLNHLKTFILEQASARPSKKRTVDGVSKLQAQKLNGLDEDHYTAKTSSESVQTLFQQYASSLRYSPQPSVPGSTKRMTILLTGSTGSLGSYLLEALYLNRDVLHIICLNQSATAAERHPQTGSKRILSPIDPERVESLKADLSKPWLGLDLSVYKRLQATVTHVIHNQWPVNFNWVLSSFEPYLRGMRNLVDFSATSAYRCFLLFVSKRIDWLPVDKLSHVLVKILISYSEGARNSKQSGTLIYHVVNPNASSWSEMAPDILRLYAQATGVQAVQYDEWVEALANSTDEVVDPERNPAVKLLDSISM